MKIYSCAKSGCEYLSQKKNDVQKHIGAHIDKPKALGFYDKYCEDCNFLIGDQTKLKLHYKTSHLDKFDEVVAKK